jgi:ABC-type transport system substrate-binding protein
MGERSYWRMRDARRLTRRTMLAASAGAGGALLLAACGGRQSSQSATSTAYAKPKPGGALTTAQNVEASDFDPTGRPTVNRPLMCYAYDSLLSWKNGPGVPYSDVAVQPGLADSWESPDGLSYVFHLHNGARFQNLPPVNGRPVTSADVKWSAQYVSRTGPIKDDKKLFPAQYADSFSGLQEIQTPDDNTAVVRFAPPFAPYLNYAAAEWNPILAHEVYERDGNFSSLLLGTGPFQLDATAVQKGTRYIYKKNPAYFRDGLPYVDQITELIILDDSTALAAFQTKQVDVLPSGRKQSWARSNHARCSRRADTRGPAEIVRPAHQYGQGAPQRRARPPGAQSGDRPRRAGTYDDRRQGAACPGRRRARLLLD